MTHVGVEGEFTLFGVVELILDDTEAMEFLAATDHHRDANQLVKAGELTEFTTSVHRVRFGTGMRMILIFESEPEQQTPVGIVVECRELHVVAFPMQLPIGRVDGVRLHEVFREWMLCRPAAGARDLHIRLLPDELACHLGLPVSAAADGASQKDERTLAVVWLDDFGNDNGRHVADLLSARTV